MLSRSQQVHGECGDQRPRKDVRSHHREHDRLGQRHKQVARYPVQEEHRNKDDRYAKCRDQGRHGDLLGAFQNRLSDFLPFTQDPIDVLDLDGGVVHKDADRERQPAEGHHVDGFMQKAEHDDRSQDGKRNRHSDDQRAAPAPEEQQDHQARQAGGDNRFTDYRPDRGSYEQGLVHQGLNL